MIDWRENWLEEIDKDLTTLMNKSSAKEQRTFCMKAEHARELIDAKKELQQIKKHFLHSSWEAASKESLLLEFRFQGHINVAKEEMLQNKREEIKKLKQAFVRIENDIHKFWLEEKDKSCDERIGDGSPDVITACLEIVLDAYSISMTDKELDSKGCCIKCGHVYYNCLCTHE